MPIYEYECRKCGVFDYEQSIADRPLARCPRCRSKVSKLISATAFHLKGGGWYADGYDRKAGSKSSSETEAGGSKSTEPAASTSDTTGSVAPAPKSTTKRKRPAGKA